MGYLKPSKYIIGNWNYKNWEKEFFRQKIALQLEKWYNKDAL